MVNNWILTLAYNNLHLTQAAINSFRAQDIEGGLQILVVDNGSTDNTRAWLHTQPDLTVIFNPVNSVANGWNRGLRWLFGSQWIKDRGYFDQNESRPVASQVEHVLVTTLSGPHSLKVYFIVFIDKVHCTVSWQKCSN